MAPQLPSLNLSGSSLSNTLTAKSMPSSPSATGTGFAHNTKPTDDMIRSTSSQSINSIGGVKSTPDRYRRNARRADTPDSGTPKTHGSAVPSGSGMAAVGQLYNHPTQSSSTPSLNSNSSYRGTNQTAVHQSKGANDDMQLGRQQNPEIASRYRRRSIGNIETAGLTHASGDSADQSSPHPNAFIQTPHAEHMSAQPVNRPSSAHKHTGSSESVSSGRSGRSSRPTSARNDSSNTSSQHGTPAQMGHIAKQDIRMVNGSSRHGDSGRRTPSGITNPSPLSRPMSPNAEDEAHAKLASKPKPIQAQSPAAEHLAALNQKDAKKSKSKLRRAFSFGSAAELRKATAQANFEKQPTPVANKRISRHEEQLDPESARVAAKQEAAGLGESIYSGQGHFFTGSTDNLSISSTASSASIMLRKMGKGMKKSTRSLVGLFRPKSVVGVPAADGPVNEVSAAQVSMVTVEAEREKVNVNVDPHTHQGGGTGFPKLERNSVDNKVSLDSGTASTDTRSRRSIVGGERERAEILAAVKKGILKRNESGQSSPSLKAADAKAPEMHLPNIPLVSDTPRSSAPSTPKDEPLHKRTDSVTIHDQHDDYFGGSGSSRFTSLDSKTGLPITPNRNISFSPRLQFHDTWTSGEYDRRGEIATCNRLTPMLAQQIKEELNSFKMEMEVHESSKVYTHFF
ncbi:bud neck involved protein [Knufia fluminis]|uniref:Bud neck involved protein n=1 Tax=Knufia fluminis TaxID=191047 RepID=A0AAN8EIW0_9EURO|nr:bud neck involved protein [Knufia fluminis]